MKNQLRILLLMFVLFFQSGGQAAERVEFVANKIHSLVVFVKSVAGDPHGSEPLKQLFENSKFHNSESEHYLQEYQDLDRALNRYISFSGYPTDRKDGESVANLVLIQSAFATSLPDFQNRMLGMLRNEEQEKLMQVLNFFEPIHEKLLWTPYHQELEKAVALYTKKSKQWKLDEMFEKASQFYNAKWPSNQKFRISLFPIPPKSRGSVASSYGAFESVGIIIGEKDIEGRFGVVFHELCHSLYDAESVEFQKQLSKWFQVNKSPFSRPANAWLNEALATVLGNGWAYYKMTGELDKTSWYNDPTIEGFSKALYPEVVKSLEADQSIDQKFVDITIQTFQKTFPQYLKDFGSLLSSVSIFTDGSFGTTVPFSKQLRGMYRIQSMNSSSPINHEESVKILKEDQSSTVLFFAKWRNTKQFESIKRDFPYITEKVEKAQKGKNLLGVFDHEGQKIIISLLNDNVGFDFIIAKLKALKQIEKLNEFLDLDTI